MRVTLPGEARLPELRIRQEEVTLVEREAETPAEVDALVALDIVGAVAADRHVVLDLPARCLGDATLRSRVDVSVVVVGPTPLDEHIAARALAETGLDAGAGTAEPPGAGPGGPVPPWLLGCGRSGGAPAAAALALAMSRFATAGEGGRPRVLPAVLPSLSRQEATRVVEGDRTARTLAAGIAVLAAMRVAGRTPRAEAVDPRAYAAELGTECAAARQADQREAGDRLHDLADELQGIRDGSKPDACDLVDAPRLEEWQHATREVRILVGRVYGHPDIPDGKRIRTSDLYACGEGWARTLSRYYRLGTPARGGFASF